MKSPLDVQVSYFKNYSDLKPVKINLMTFLKSAKYAEKVKQIRAIQNKLERDKEKALLPAITPSGLFTTRSKDVKLSDKLIQHSGLIQFDIDFAHNKHITNYAELKNHLCNITNIAYCGLSVSGLGFWGLIPIQYPEHHNRHFQALFCAFKEWGLTLDEIPKNVSSIRGYSYDSAGYFNHNPELFTLLADPPKTNDRKYPTKTGTRNIFVTIQNAENVLHREGLHFKEGSRHNYIFRLCSILNYWGIERGDAESYIEKHLMPLTDIQSNCISYPYEQNSHYFGAGTHNKQHRRLDITGGTNKKKQIKSNQLQ